MGGGEVDLSTFFFSNLSKLPLSLSLSYPGFYTFAELIDTLYRPHASLPWSSTKKKKRHFSLKICSSLSLLSPPNSTMSTAWQRFTYWLKSGPPAPGTAQRRLSTSTQKTFKRNPLTDLPLDDYLVKQLDASWTKLLANVHPNGSTPGAVVASPSKAKPDYW